jgi:competence protein ComEC
MKYWKYTFGTLILILFLILLAIFQLPDKNLHIIACNVGQGDAILITYKEIQILTDGGPDTSVLSCLGKYMPFWDRDIELVISTHPDADHSTGLVEVLKTYNVAEILINPGDPGTEVFRALESEVGSGGVKVLYPVGGMKLRVGMIYLDILSPTQEQIDSLVVKDADSVLAKYEVKEETNLYSIVYKLSFKNFSGLFTGDMPPEVSDRLSRELGMGVVNYIKIPHHGSVNGITENLLKVVVPKVAIISLGKNPWGFPRPEILDMLGRYNVNVLRTDKEGDIEVVTDGNKYWIK